MDNIDSRGAASLIDSLSPGAARPGMRGGQADAGTPGSNASARVATPRLIALSRGNDITRGPSSAEPGRSASICGPASFNQPGTEVAGPRLSASRSVLTKPPSAAQRAADSPARGVSLLANRAVDANTCARTGPRRRLAGLKSAAFLLHGRSWSAVGKQVT